MNKWGKQIHNRALLCNISVVILIMLVKSEMSYYWKYIVCHNVVVQTGMMANSINAKKPIFFLWKMEIP